MNPVIELVTSKPFITTVIGLIVAVLIAAVPALEPAQDALILSLTAIILAVVGGQAYTDGQLIKAEAALELEESRVNFDREQRAFYASQNASTPEPLGALEVSHYDADSARMAALLALDELINHADAGDYNQARTVIRKMVADEARIQLHSVG